ncbi:hypothetical protein GDO78_003300 [Eleutherodactylus coqui]|uniref:Uncharacterized protein n=1 Tax=Eleutherodactylus coqui TaxID=57060 RepID=A0A8J6ETN3_ELECQ|nr:hypothetical protein GDO78_003300 [Eleutherodactylus coqui]
MGLASKCIIASPAPPTAEVNRSRTNGGTSCADRGPQSLAGRESPPLHYYCRYPIARARGSRRVSAAHDLHMRTAYCRPPDRPRCVIHYSCPHRLSLLYRGSKPSRRRPQNSAISSRSYRPEA